MPVAFIKYTSLQGFPYHWEGGKSNFTSHISPSHPFLILIQASILEMILKEKIYDGILMWFMLDVRFTENLTCTKSHSF